jgi:diguanylate cyclase (GGDEF)-like protein
VVNFDFQTSPRAVRPVLLLLGLAGYVLFIWLLLDEGLNGSLYQGRQFVGSGTYLLWLPIWVLGMVGLVLRPGRLRRLEDDTINLVLALWCNIGAVTLALLVPHMLRLLLLAMPLCGVIYAAIYLSRGQVMLLATTTATVYLLNVLSELVGGRLDTEFEVLSGAAFAVLLGGAWLLAAELQRMRDQLLERNGGLRDALERAQDMALKDDLTRLHNRRSVLELISRQKALSDRGQPAFTLCYCDLDHFKRINDRYGHAVGDVALRQFAALASAVVRNVDYVARFGGEEFLLVLVDADAQTAAQVARRLADKTRDMRIPGTPEGFSLTVSVGIASYLPHEQTDDLIGRADHALYSAKRAGRDQVMIAD